MERRSPFTQAHDCVLIQKLTGVLALGILVKLFKFIPHESNLAVRLLQLLFSLTWYL
jgi:hypothetical protein